MEQSEPASKIYFMSEEVRQKLIAILTPKRPTTAEPATVCVKVQGGPVLWERKGC